VLPSVRVTGEGPPLLLVHGGPGLNDYMGMLDGEVAGWQRIRYQQRGLEPSDPHGPFEVRQHVADLFSVLDETGFERCVILGHSWGGHLALRAAIAAPHRVAALVLVDPMGSAGDGGLVAMGAELMARLSQQARDRVAELDARLSGPGGSPADFAEHMSLIWPSYFADAASAPPVPPDLALSAECNEATMASALQTVKDGSFAAQLAGVNIATVILLGDRSPIPLEKGHETAGLLPAAEVMVAGGAGHFPWVEQPGCVASALARVSEAKPG
jgi:pimeloyl-ACP methyl ester carboxylesterase